MACACGLHGNPEMKRFRSVVFRCFAALLPMFACAHAPPAMAILEASAGELDPTVARGTVAVVIEDTGEVGPNGQHGYYPSSGVVIARDWILTVKHGFAAHAAARYSWQIHFAPEIRAGTSGNAIHEVRRGDVFPHPTLDLALVRITAMPFAYQPVRIPINWTRMAEGPAPRAVLAGFGPARGLRAPNRLRSVEEPVSATDLTQTRRRPDLVPPAQAGLHLEIDQRDGRGSCSGDSGGPVFLRDSTGRLGLIGVIRGNASYNGEHPCLAYSYAVRVDRVIDWLAEVTGKFYNAASMSLVDVSSARPIHIAHHGIGRLDFTLRRVSGAAP